MEKRESRDFALLHTRRLYGKAPKLKMGKSTFLKNSESAHLIGRAFACEKIIKKHEEEPYENVDIMLGDLQIELVECVNKFKQVASVSNMEKYQVEIFIKKES